MEGAINQYIDRIGTYSTLGKIGKALGGSTSHQGREGQGKSCQLHFESVGDGRSAFFFIVELEATDVTPHTACFNFRVIEELRIEKQKLGWHLDRLDLFKLNERITKSKTGRWNGTCMAGMGVCLFNYLPR
jgi:hypothetical protein